MINNWRKYNHALIPTLPPHQTITNSKKEILKILRDSRSLFARYTTNFDTDNKTLFWYIINDRSLDMKDYDIKTRNQIRKGLKLCSVRMISKVELSKYGYEVYSKAFENYKTFNKMESRATFNNNVKEISSNSDLWGVFSLEGKLIGYSKNNIQKNVCEFSSTKFHPDFLKNRPSEALFYTMCSYYMNERGFKYIHNGTKSIAHHTNIQKFLIKKFKFRKAFCDLHILYIPEVKFLVNILYPFRRLISKSRINLLKKISIVLFQEEIKRNQIND